MSLILTRRAGESFESGEATVYIDHISEGRVKVRVDAPPHIRIRRDELDRKDADTTADG